MARPRLSLVPGLLLLAAMASPGPAAAQTWRQYAYPEAGFAAQFPAEPRAARGTYRTAAGVSVPAVTYSVEKDNIVYAVTTADFTGAPMEQEAALVDAVKVLVADGRITLEVTERIDRQYGRELSIEGRDGSRTTAAIFFFNSRLYALIGKALPPDPAAGSGKTSRFQQSLVFIDRQGVAPRRPDDGLPGGGPGRGPPPPD